VLDEEEIKQVGFIRKSAENSVVAGSSPP